MTKPLGELPNRLADKAANWRLIVIAVMLVVVALTWGLAAAFVTAGVAYLSLEAGILMQRLNTMNGWSRSITVDSARCAEADAAIRRRNEAIEVEMSKVTSARQ